MVDAVVYDMHPQNLDLEALRAKFDALPDYPQKDFDFRLTAVIGEYMNGRGVAFPGMGILAEQLHCFKMDVKRGVDRILPLDVFTVRKVKSEGARWEHNVYIFAKRFLRKTVDKLARHFDAAKWKVWVEEKMSARQRGKLIRRYCEQIDRDLENAGVTQGHWVAMRYMVKHVHETPEEYETILAEAIQKYRDYAGPNFLKIEDRPVLKPALPVPAPVQEKPAEPVGDVSEQDKAKMFRVFDKHPELLNNPVEAARLAGVVLPDMEPVQEQSASAPAHEPALQADKPTVWEDGSVWPTGPLTKPTTAPMPVKQQTDLNTLPANTTSVVGSTNTQPVQLDMTNAPKFINGEVSALWETQQLLHEINPTMYPAY